MCLGSKAQASEAIVYYISTHTYVHTDRMHQVSTLESVYCHIQQGAVQAERLASLPLASQTNRHPTGIQGSVL